MGVIKYSNYDLGDFLPEVKPRDTKHTVVIIAIQYFNKEHILMARSKVKGIFTYKNPTFYSAKYSKVSNHHL